MGGFLWREECADGADRYFPRENFPVMFLMNLDGEAGMHVDS